MNITINKSYSGHVSVSGLLVKAFEIVSQLPEMVSLSIQNQVVFVQCHMYSLMVIMLTNPKNTNLFYAHNKLGKLVPAHTSKF